MKLFSVDVCAQKAAEGILRAASFIFSFFLLFIFIYFFSLGEQGTGTCVVRLSEAE